MTAQRYRDILETVLPGLLEDVPLIVRQRLWFQLALWGRCSAVVERDITRKVVWMSRANCINSLVARSNSGGFFLWGHLKEHVDAVPHRTIEDFVARLPTGVTMVNVNIL
jgi:hypothetical protein